MTVRDILNVYDVEGKKIEELSYLSEYRSCDEEERKTIPCIAESLAFELREDFKSENDQFAGRFYYGPQIVTSDEQGRIFEYPDRNSITKEIIEYWESRIATSNNIQLKARYAGLTWEFKFQVCGEKPDFNIALIYIDSLIECVEGDIPTHPVLSIKKIKRAIILSHKYGQHERLNRAKVALHDLIERHYEDQAIGIWGAKYVLIEENPAVYTPEEQADLMADLQRKFNAFYAKPSDLKTDDHRDPWQLMQIAGILAEYYKKHHPDKITVLLGNVENAFDSLAGQLNKLQLIGNYTQLYSLYRKYHLEKEAQALSIKIADTGKGIQNEMAHIKQEFEISREQTDAVNRGIFTDDVEKTIASFSYNYIPKMQAAHQSVVEMAKQYPLVFMMPTTLFDYKGRPKAVIGNIDTDLGGQIVSNTSMTMNTDVVFINATIEEGRQRGIFTLDNIIGYLEKNPAIEEDRLPIIIRGLEAYYDSDFLVSIHLLIPQIEEIIRNMMDINRIPTLKPSRNGNGFQLRILDDILRDEQAIECLTEDFANYLRILLTDNRGWNVRNDVCHGFAQPSLFNKMTADRIFHALVCFGAFQLVEQNPI